MAVSPESRVSALAKKAKERKDAEVLESQMEFWPDAKRAVPNALIRCALFTATLAEASGERLIRKEVQVASLAGYKVYYSGEDLDQKDMDTLMTIIQLFRGVVAHNTIEVSGHHLLTMMGLSNTGPNHKALQARIKRLLFTRIDIIPDDDTKYSSFHGPLLAGTERSAEGRVWSISLSPQLRGLFNDGYTRIDYEIRQDLRRSPMAQWLHTFYRSHKTPYPISISTLYELSGSQTKELRFFRGNLKKALTKLEKACKDHGVVFHWTYVKRTDQIHVAWENWKLA